MLSLLVAIGFIAFGIYRHRQNKPMTAFEWAVLLGLLICTYVAMTKSPPNHHIIRHMVR